MGLYFWLFLRTYSSDQSIAEKNLGRIHRWRIRYRVFRSIGKFNLANLRLLPVLRYLYFFIFAKSFTDVVLPLPIRVFCLSDRIQRNFGTHDHGLRTVSVVSSARVRSSAVSVIRSTIGAYLTKRTTSVCSHFTITTYY